MSFGSSDACRVKEKEVEQEILIENLKVHFKELKKDNSGGGLVFISMETRFLFYTSFLSVYKSNLSSFLSVYIEMEIQCSMN